MKKIFGKMPQAVVRARGLLRALALCLLLVLTLPAAQDIVLPAGTITGTKTFGPARNITVPAAGTTIGAGADITLIAANIVLTPEFIAPNTVASVHIRAITPDLVIQQQPVTRAVRQNERVTYDVIVSSSYPISFQWQRLAPSGATWENILLATTARYVSSLATTAEAGARYRCVMTDQVMDATSAEVEFLVAPSGDTPYLPLVQALPSATVTTRDVQLVASATDDDGAPTITWSQVSGPSGAQTTFTVNGSTSAGQTQARFTKPGTYVIRATAAYSSVSATRDITVDVVATATSMRIAPSIIQMMPGRQLQLSGSVLDQFGAAIATQPTIAWSVSGGASISTGGLLTASASPLAGQTVTATGGGLSAIASLAIGNPDLPVQTVYEVVADKHFPTATSDPAQGIATTFAYTWHPGSNQIASRTVTIPAVATAQNGENATTSTISMLDAWGRVVWARDGASAIDYFAYDDLTGSVICTLRDVDTTRTSDFIGLPSGWTTPSGFGAHLKTTTVVDDFGRPIDVTDPAGRRICMTYNDAARERRTYSGWTGTATTGPTIVQRTDWRLGYAEELAMTIEPQVASGRPTGAETISQVVALTRERYDDNGRVTARDRYLDLAAGSLYSKTSALLGTSGTNYETSQVAYDTRGRVIGGTDAAGTSTRLVLDPLGRTRERWEGLTLPTGTWSRTNPGTLVRVSVIDYDGNGSGLSLPTSEMAVHGSGSGDLYTTRHAYDWRGYRTRTLAPDGRLSVLTNDNLGRATQTELYVSVTDIAAAPVAAAQRARSTAEYDVRGQVWRERSYEVAQASGAAGDRLETTHWHDRRGLRIKTRAPNGLLTKQRFDGTGRVVRSWSAIDTGAAETYADAGTFTNDQVIEQANTWYDRSSLAIASATFWRKDNAAATSTGELTAATAPYRVSVAWFDLAARPTASVDYGRDPGRRIFDAAGVLIATNGIPTVATQAPPAVNSSDDYQVATTTYTIAGRIDLVTDNGGRSVKTITDDAGQVKRTIERYIDGTFDPTKPDEDRITEQVYAAGGLVAQIKATTAQGSTTVVQITRMLRESAQNKAWVTSAIGPDSTDTTSAGTDQVKTTYDRLGRVRTVTDQRGVVHTYDFDSVGRPLHDRVTTLPSGVDGHVRRISMAYDTLGRPLRVTSHGDVDPAVATAVRNEVQWAYADWGPATTIYQAHSGLVDTATTLKVSYAYADGAASGVAKYVRPTSVVYPDGRTIGLAYPGDTTIGGALSRLDKITDGITGTPPTWAQYAWFGAGRIAKTTLTGTGGSLVLDRSKSAAYSTYDQLWRLKEHIWRDGSSAKAGSTQVYDRVNNITAIKNGWTTSVANRDDAMSHDGLDRLVGHRRGALTASNVIADASSVRLERWTLDAVGNWGGYTLDADGGAGAGAALAQTRTHNLANEIDTNNAHGDAAGNAIAGGMDWIDPVYNAAGAMTSGPVPATPATRQHYVYDAWGRLTAMHADSAGAPAATASWTARYDGLHRRIIVVAGTLTTDVYHDAGGREVELRRSDTSREQLVWGARGELIRQICLRTDATTAQVIILTDHQGSVAASILASDSTRAIRERYRYDAYGRRQMLDAAGVVKAVTAALDNLEIGYTGHRLDVATGLYYAQARYLDPNLGRFISRDPAGFVDGVNLYQYVRGNPFGLVDPMGLAAALSESQALSGWQRAGYGLLGLLEFAAGVASGAAGTATSATGVGAVAGYAGMAYMADQASTSFSMMWSGQRQESTLTTAARNLGGDYAAQAYNAAGTVITLAPAVYQVGGATWRLAERTLDRSVARGLSQLDRGGLVPLDARYSVPFATKRPTLTNLAAARLAPGGVNYGALDGLRRPTGIHASPTALELGTGSDACRRLRPPGFEGGAAGHSRGHLYGAAFGGSGYIPQNLVTMFNRANSQAMNGFEIQIRNAIASRQTVSYSAIPVYRGSELVPRGVTLSAEGSSGFSLNVTVLNRPSPR